MVGGYAAVAIPSLAVPCPASLSSLYATTNLVALAGGMIALSSAAIEIQVAKPVLKNSDSELNETVVPETVPNLTVPLSESDASSYATTKVVAESELMASV